MAEDYGKALGYDDEISKENEFETIPEGDYTFTVVNLERAQYEPKEGAKMCACPQVNITLKIRVPQQDGSTVDRQIVHPLFLNTKMEGRISEFFEGIGLKKKGDPFRMAWNSVIGKTGKCKVYIDKYTNPDGKNYENNKIRKFYYKADASATSFTPGKF